MSDFLAWMLPYKLDTDDRQPMIGILLPPSIAFWLQVLWIIALQSILSAILSLITYKFIVKSSNPSRFVVGYGILLPLWLFLPKLQLQAFGMRNMVINFCLSGIIPTLNIFHTMEAMYDTVPEYASQSLSHYALYCGSPMTLEWNKKSQSYTKTTFTSICKHYAKFVLYLLLTGLLQSFLAIHDYQPFYQTRTIPYWKDALRIFSIQQLGNNVCHALLFQLYLTSFCEGMILATCILFGKEPLPVMENPLFESTSPSNFWSKRWNKLVHGVLKRGVYIPVRKANLPTSIAVLSTFLASSLFHEWILTNLFYNVHSEKWIHFCGGSTVFLLWNGMLLVFESLLYKLSIFQWMKQHLPTPIKTMLVVIMGVPLAHLFCDPYVYSSFFQHGQVAFPMFQVVSKFESV